MKRLFQTTLILSVVFVYACQDSTPKCKYKPPAPFFTTESPDVVKHDFKLKDMNSTETVRFSTDLGLTVYQSGCDRLKQEYHFEMADAPATDAASWIGLAAEKMDYISSGGPAIMPIAKGLSGIMGAEKANMNLSETYDLVDMGVSLKIDKVEGGQNSSIIVTMEELKK